MDNKYFQEALSSLANNVAYGDAIKHMHDSGLTPSEIHDRLDYPISIAKIESVIYEYEKKKASDSSNYEYIEHQDNLGRRSFIRVSRHTSQENDV